MLKFKRETDLGLVFLEALAELKQGEYLSLQQWAKTRSLPYRFLSKVAGNLKRAGLIRAREGKTGGYCLVRPAKKVSLGQVVGALEGKVALVRCATQGKCSCQSFCRHRGLMERLGKTLEAELNGVSLDALYANNR